MELNVELNGSSDVVAHLLFYAFWDAIIVKNDLLYISCQLKPGWPFCVHLSHQLGISQFKTIIFSYFSCIFTTH